MIPVGHKDFKSTNKIEAVVSSQWKEKVLEKESEREFQHI